MYSSHAVTPTTSHWSKKSIRCGRQQLKGHFHFIDFLVAQGRDRTDLTIKLSRQLA